MAARGIGKLEVNGNEVPILFTNRALINAEKQTGKGIGQMLNDMMNNNFVLGDLVALLRTGMDAARQDSKKSGRPVSNEDALAVIDEIGFTSAVRPVMEAVAEVIAYNSPAEADQGADPN